MSSKKPKLKITLPNGEIKCVSLEEATPFLFLGKIPMFVKGRLIRTYKELQDLVAKEENRNKEIIEIKYLITLGG